MLSDSALLQRIAKIISGAPFPSSRTMTKAEKILALIEEGRQSAGDRVKALEEAADLALRLVTIGHDQFVSQGPAFALSRCRRAAEVLETVVFASQAAPVEQGEG